MINFNSIQTGLLAILLSLCGYWAMIGFTEDDLSLEVKNGTKIFKGCCYRCYDEFIYINENGSLTFENRNFDLNILAIHLEQHNMAYPLRQIAIIASEGTQTTHVVKVTDFLKGKFPEIPVSWAVSKNT